MRHATGHQASQAKSPSGHGKPGEAPADGVRGGRLCLGPAARLAGLSAYRQVYVAQDICFSFQIFQPLLDDIDDADELAVVNHQQMPHVIICH